MPRGAVPRRRLRLGSAQDGLGSGRAPVRRGPGHRQRERGIRPRPRRRALGRLRVRPALLRCGHRRRPARRRGLGPRGPPRLLLRALGRNPALRGAGRRDGGGGNLPRPDLARARSHREPGRHSGGDLGRPRRGGLGAERLLRRAGGRQRLRPSRHRGVPESRSPRQDRGGALSLRPVRPDDRRGLRRRGTAARPRLDRVHRVVVPAAGALAPLGAGNLAVHAAHGPSVRTEVERHRGRAQRPREGDPRRGPLPRPTFTSSSATGTSSWRPTTPARERSSRRWTAPGHATSGSSRRPRPSAGRRRPTCRPSSPRS